MMNNLYSVGDKLIVDMCKAALRNKLEYCINSKSIHCDNCIYSYEFMGNYECDIACCIDKLNKIIETDFGPLKDDKNV